MSEKSDDVGAFLAGFVIGALVGAAAALVLAPQSGEDTRTGLASRGRTWRSSGSERLSQVSTALAEVRARAGEAEGEGQPLPRILLNRARGQSASSTAHEHMADSEADEAGDTSEDG